MGKTKRSRKLGPPKPWGEEGHTIRQSKSRTRVRVRLPKGGGPTDYRTGQIQDVVAKPKKKKGINPWRFTEKEFNEFINQ